MSSNDIAVLQLLVTRGVGPRTVDRVLASTLAHAGGRTDLGAAQAGDWVQLGLKPVLAQAVVDARQEAQRLRELLESHGVRLLVRGTPNYPPRLDRPWRGNPPPPVLFARGNLDVLSLPAVAFSGSRKASPEGLNWTRACASRFAGEGVNVVSGYAGGVDLAAHAAALRAGGVTTLILAEGILRFTCKRELADLLDDQRHLILSEFAPRLPWSAGNAMQRNGTILRLADAVIIVEAGLSGGTFAAAEEAVKNAHPLFVVDYPAPPDSAAGNRHFLAQGARPLAASTEPDLSEAFRALRRESAARAPAPTPELVQRSLFDAGEPIP